VGEKETEPFQFAFNGFLKVAFQGSRVTSDAGLILVRELDGNRRSAQSLTALTVMVLAILLSKAAFAQTRTTPFQIAGEFSVLGLDRDYPASTGTAGFGLRTEFTLASHVEVETRVIWFPAELQQEFQAQGGQTLQAAAGIRGKLWSSSRVSIYGLLLPGLLHVSNTVVSQKGVQSVSGGATHFSLDTGVGVEWYVGNRWTAHFETSRPLYGAPGGEIDRSPPDQNGRVVTVSALARFVNPWQVSSGIGYRFGTQREAEPAMSNADRWEIGADFTQMTAFDGPPFSTDFQHIPALGLFVTYRLAPAVYVDAAVHSSLRPVATQTDFEGGRLLQALGGAKVGVRQNRYGVFGKFRAGVNSYSGAFASGDSATATIQTRRSNLAAIDVGVVIERYVSRRWLIRFDGGDVLSFYRPTNIMINGRSIPIPSPARTDSIQLIVGVGYRL
jgi:hypothetical protein